MEPNDLFVRQERDGPVGLLAVAGEIRLETGARLHVAGIDLLEQGADHLLVDLSGVTFMDSASFGVLIRLERALRERGGRLVLFGCSKAVQRVLENAGLDERFAVAADEAEARTRASSPS